MTGGGPCKAILVKDTASAKFRLSLPVIILSYMLNIPSAGASVKAQGLSLKSVFSILSLMNFPSQLCMCHTLIWHHWYKKCLLLCVFLGVLLIWKTDLYFLLCIFSAHWHIPPDCLLTLIAREELVVNVIFAILHFSHVILWSWYAETSWLIDLIFICFSCFLYVLFTLRQMFLGDECFVLVSVLCGNYWHKRSATPG